MHLDMSPLHKNTERRLRLIMEVTSVRMLNMMLPLGVMLEVRTIWVELED